MRCIVVKCALVCAFVFSITIASAQDVGPDVLLQDVTAEVVELLQARRGHLNVRRTNEVNDLVENKVLPLFDFRRMTQNAVGRSWNAATPEQRTALTAEFRTLLVRTYTEALRTFRHHVIEFKPLDMQRVTTEATVRSAVKKGGAERLAIDYDLAKTSAGWKIHEIRIDGVNLTDNYRPTFAARVRDVGLDGLIKILADKNRQSG